MYICIYYKHYIQLYDYMYVIWNLLLTRATKHTCIENLRERLEAYERRSETNELFASKTLANAHMLQESEGEIFGNSCTLVLTRAFSGVHGFGRASSSTNTAFPWSKFEWLCQAMYFSSAWDWANQFWEGMECDGCQPAECLPANTASEYLPTH